MKLAKPNEIIRSSRARLACRCRRTQNIEIHAGHCTLHTPHARQIVSKYTHTDTRRGKTTERQDDGGRPRVQGIQRRRAAYSPRLMK